ncbi:EAL domain-containing protein [Gilvimarinus agarilyticus]|uniref:EAL domain-containing protein n=1 Tax=unclassified Gilvimarinus TaxID=2642066 RepID=UPI001C09389F|nr:MULTISPECIES: EAL domain-containing protein [unclassified Gilvimarinus]MBU2887606.1 EAL domain-containing protein [Gilvimarinus agarilyticus]MDO6572257.1 EAL domain-containing protein [Gilvimarinus sp. 2_MG-2023]MDO6746824.1 EAL domain-containing protein [Gilvimarinus sp. 1_MG-2023]
MSAAAITHRKTLLLKGISNNDRSLEHAVSIHYYLEGYSADSLKSRRYELRQLPAVAGRHADCALQLNMESVSRQHARFELLNGKLLVTDLGSTNGTFVNRQSITEPTELDPGDVLHLGDHEFRLMVESDSHTQIARDSTRVGIGNLPSQFPLHTREFFELLQQRLVHGYKQVITHNDGTPFGYELLGRGAHPVIGESPAVLFNLAETLDSEVALSQLFRQECFADAAKAKLDVPLFFNTHPNESKDFDTLLSELTRLRTLFPMLTLVFEVHEAAITDLDAMAEVRRALNKLDIGLAYDDFGAGQARLLEVVEVPPDYLKFDIALVRDLEGSTTGRYQLLSTLNELICGLGIKTLAEGVETERTAQLCREMGIHLIQGFLYGRPGPIIES